MLNETNKSFFNKKMITVLIAGVVILALLIVAVATGTVHNLLDCPDCVPGIVDCETCHGVGQVEGSFWALLPPIIAIGLALITKEVYSSLFIGILSGAILANDFAFAGTVDSVVSTGVIDAVSGTAGIFVFLVELGLVKHHGNHITQTSYAVCLWKHIPTILNPYFL